MNWIWIVLGILLGVYLFFALFPAIGIFIGVFSHKKCIEFTDETDANPVYAPHAARYIAGAAFLSALPVTEVSVTARDGTVLKADYFDGGFDRTAVLVAGYAVVPLYNYSITGKELYEAGYNLLMIWQRGHGKSGGRFTGLGLLESEDLPLWADWVRENTNAKKILVYGTSMGAATVGYASEALNGKADAMIMDCGFDSVWDVMAVECRARHIPVSIELPIMRMIVRLVLGVDVTRRVTDSLSKTTVPAFFLHGTADPGVPIEQGKANYAACASPKECFWVEGASHGVAYAVGGEESHRRLFAFLDRCMDVSRGD